MITRPMKAEKVKGAQLANVAWPALCSPKVDGIRGIIHPQLGVVTTSFKPLPNVYTRERLGALVGNKSLDGELVVVDGQGRALLFNDIQSELMSHGGLPDFRFLVFDCFDYPNDPFMDRYDGARARVEDLNNKHVKIIKHRMIYDSEQFLEYMQECLTLGYEGAMIRDPEGPYKSGRSTLKQGWLLKYKEWLDAEGVITGFEELMHNENEDEGDNFGLAKRSHRKEGMVPAGTLGNLIVDTEWGELSLGSGFDHAQRQEIWNANMIDRKLKGKTPEWSMRGERPLFVEPSRDLGRTVTFKYQPHGMQDKPRFPVFLRFREDE